MGHDRLTVISIHNTTTHWNPILEHKPSLAPHSDYFASHRVADLAPCHAPSTTRATPQEHHPEQLWKGRSAVPLPFIMSHAFPRSEPGIRGVVRRVGGDRRRGVITSIRTMHRARKIRKIKCMCISRITCTTSVPGKSADSRLV